VTDDDADADDDDYFDPAAPEDPKPPAQQALEDFVKQKAASKGSVTNSVEFQRIKGMPRRVLDLEHGQDATPLFVKATGKMRLRPVQSAALIEAAKADGLFAPVGVGHGKTLLSLLLPTALDSKKAVLLVPPALKKQLAVEIARIYSVNFHLPLKTLTIVAYSELSSAKKADILTTLAPDLIVADECHLVRYKTSSRTKRLLRFAKDHPACRFAFLSGTITTRSLKDYAHLIELALRKNSPLPGNYREVEDWAGAIDVKPRYVMMPGVLKQFCEAREDVRAGFRRRLVETQGVVATTESSLGTSLIVRRLAPPVPWEVEADLAKVRSTWQVGGEEISSALDLARALKQIACGFYYRWVWPDGVVDHEWLTARAAWHKEIRAVLRMSKEGLDSPLLCALAAERHRRNLPGKQWQSDTWGAWSMVKHRKTPPTESVWIHDFLVHEALAWGARERREGPAIIWYEHKAFGERVAEVGELPLYDAGTDASQADAPVIVCALRVQGTGRNLQHYSRNLLTTMPPNGATFEQVVGRTHRQGQEADEVMVDWYAHTPEMNDALAKVIDDAEYIEETTGQRQKAVYATKI